jgi:hypothetical protein
VAARSTYERTRAKLVTHFRLQSNLSQTSRLAPLAARRPDGTRRKVRVAAANLGRLLGTLAGVEPEQPMYAFENVDGQSKPPAFAFENVPELSGPSGASGAAAGSSVSGVPVQRGSGSARESLPVPFVPAGPSKPPVRAVRWPMWLAITFGVLSMVCVGVGAVAFRYYDKATRTDRSSPSSSMVNYLNAVLLSHDNSAAVKFSCSDADLGAFVSFRDAAESLAAGKSASVSFDWVLVDIQSDRHQASVDVTVEQDTSTNGQVLARSFHVWRFRLLNDDGWRVCGANSVS